MKALKDTVIAVVGGDLRQAYLAGSLSAMGIKVYAAYLEKGIEHCGGAVKSNHINQVFGQCDVIIFPLPFSTDEITVNTPFSSDIVRLDECLNHIKEGSLILGGKITKAFTEIAARKNIEVIDYLEREDLAIMNAVPTAEGTIEIAMRELPTTIFGLKCLITGYGRIGKVLARILCAMGARVTVAARSYGDIAAAKTQGCEAIHMSQLESVIHETDLVVNTIPVVILTENILSKIKPGALLIDLASKPGGVDFDTAKHLGVNTIWALSLPGKVAPISAGEIIKETVLNILNEKGDC